TSFAFSWRSMVAALTGASGEVDTAPGEVSRKAFLRGLVAVLVLAVLGQWFFYDIAPWLGVVAVLMTFLLAIVAGRVTGETNITPIGPMGKITQLTFGVLSPGNAATNLMAANVTGGAASQCGDLLHDLKAGLMLGASPRQQAIA